MSDILLEDKLRRKAFIKEIGKRIKQARDESRMSQLQVGVALAVSDKTISGYESGRIAPPIDKLMDLADLFKKPVSFFVASDPREFKVATRLRSVEASLKEVRKQLNEIKLLSEIKNLDK